MWPGGLAQPGRGNLATSQRKPSVPFHTARKTLLSSCSSRTGRRVILASALLVLGTKGLQNAVANGDTRTLTIHHTHTGEDITVTYKRDGRYDEAGLAKLNHFLRDWRNHEQTKMDPRLFDVVWEVYQDVGAREPIQIISAYRSPQTNAMLRRRSRGVAQFSQHMLGKAMDFNIPGVPLDQVRAAGLRAQRGGVGFYPTSGSPFVHLDVGSIRHWPRMTREQLVRVFPNGRTVHVPSDGHPLSGYALALADVQRRGSAPSQTSLASARSAGVVTADASETTSGKRGFFAKLFGTGQSDDEEEADSKTQSPRRALAAAKDESAASPKASAAMVPMPRTRPAKPEIAVAQASVAPAASAPAPVKIAAPKIASNATPAQIVEARGVWRAEYRHLADAAPPPRTAARKGAQRFEVASVEPTALPRFPGQPEPEKPTESLLSFAPVESARPASRPRALPTMIRSANATVVPRTTQPVRAAMAAAGRADNPWLRGVLLSPSIHTAMGVTTIGLPKYRELADLIHKPAITVAMTFIDEPESLDTLEFRGSAVSFVPTLTFGQIVASGHN